MTKYALHLTMFAIMITAIYFLVAYSLRDEFGDCVRHGAMFNATFTEIKMVCGELK